MTKRFMLMLVVGLSFAQTATASIVKEPGSLTGETLVRGEMVACGGPKVPPKKDSIAAHVDHDSIASSSAVSGK